MSSEERAELLDVMVEQGSDLTNIISDLLVAAKADIGALEVESVPVNLHAQILQVLDSIEQVANVDVTGEQVRALGDADRIRQVLRNLVSNAVRYGATMSGLSFLPTAPTRVCSFATVDPRYRRRTANASSSPIDVPTMPRDSSTPGAWDWRSLVSLPVSWAVT